MNRNFFKFPSTPHLVVPEGVEFRGDKVMTACERADFLQHDLHVEEKIDGANLGISFDGEGNILVQNRGSWLSLPASGQWKKLDAWLMPKQDILFEYLTDRYILFGEWCYAKHSVEYDRLPDWFLGFDVYDKIYGRFLSVPMRDALLASAGVAGVPGVARGKFTLDDIKKMLTRSRFGQQQAEGLYLRFDSGNYLAQRAKLVRRSFVQSMEQHWSCALIVPNRISAQTEQISPA